jgi:hypothetical protein
MQTISSFFTKYGLAICCLVGPLAFGFLAPNLAANYLMPIGDKKPVVNFVFPNGETDSAARAEKARSGLAAKQKTTAEKQNELDRLMQPPADQERIKSAKTAVEEARSAEADARAEADKAEKDRATDRTIAQSKQISETLTARYNFTAISGVLYLVSVATLLFGGAIVFRHDKRWLFFGLPASALFALAASWLLTAYENAGLSFLRFLLDQADNHENFKPLFEAYRNATPPASAPAFQVSHAVRLILEINTFIGLLAVGVALLAFAALSVSEEKPSYESLLWRKRDLQRMLALSSAILVVATFACKVLLNWPLGLLAPAQSETLKPLATALTTHLGMCGTIALLAAAVPALVGWLEDVRRFRLSPEFSATHPKHDLGKLDFAISGATANIIAILAPALTSPLFSSLSAIIDLFAGKIG